MEKEKLICHIHNMEGIVLCSKCTEESMLIMTKQAIKEVFDFYEEWKVVIEVDGNRFICLREHRFKHLKKKFLTEKQG